MNTYHNVLFYENNLEDYFDGVFLAGPTVRNGNFEDSWRKEAIKFLREVGYDGYIVVPECLSSVNYSTLDHDNIIEWELEGMRKSLVVMFWVPRSTELPGFTTNVEFGYNIGICATRVVLGYPENAERMKYLDYIYRKFGYGDKPQHTLINTCKRVKKVHEGRMIIKQCEISMEDVEKDE